MQILGLIFAQMCIFSTQNLLLLSTWRAALKSSWSGVITTFTVILMQLLRQHFSREWHHSLVHTPPPYAPRWHLFSQPPLPIVSRGCQPLPRKITAHLKVQPPPSSRDINSQHQHWQPPAQKTWLVQTLVTHQTLTKISI